MLSSGTGKIWRDATFSTQNLKLHKEEAAQRAILLDQVAYKLKIGMQADNTAPHYYGHLKVNFKLNVSDKSPLESFYIDFHGEQISNVVLNGKAIDDEAAIAFNNHRIMVKQADLLKTGESDRNELSLSFKNTFVDNSAGLHKYTDPKDG